MWKFILVSFFIFIPAMCFAQGDDKTANVEESPVLKQAKKMVDKEIEAMNKFASVNKGKGFNKQMVKGLMVKLGTNKADRKKRIEEMAAKLSKEEKEQLEQYSKTKGTGSKALVALNDPGAVKAWCDTYHGTAATDNYCTGFVKWCWDVCNLSDGSKKYYESPYVCGGCVIF